MIEAQKKCKGRQSPTGKLNVPPYSPELNPMEQIWQQLRLRQGHCFASYDAVVEACCEAWNGFTSTQEAVKQLCTRNWAKLV